MPSELEARFAELLQRSRELSGGVCLTLNKCCGYHEGFSDALDVAEQALSKDRPALEAKVAEAITSAAFDGLTVGDPRDAARIALDAIFGEATNGK